MANVCKGICSQYKALGFKGKHKYVQGQKRCAMCEIFLYYEGIRCPCCGVKLRITPKGNKQRKEMQIKKKYVWQ